MSVIDSLNKMQRDAVEQLRAGDHNEFLVGFLTTSVMLELSNLVAADLDLDSYVHAVVEVMTQHAPIERCLLGLDPRDLPAVFAAIGFESDLAAGHAQLVPGPDTARIDVEEVVTGTLHVDEVPAALQTAQFLEVAAAQIASSLHRVVEGEQLRRRAAAAKALRAVAALDERWGAAELEAIAIAISALPAVTGATINATASRFAGTLTVEAGRGGAHRLGREFVVDGQLEMSLTVDYVEEPGADHVARLDDVTSALVAGLERIEQNIRLAAEADTDQLTGVGNRRRASKALAQARTMADTKGQPMSVLLCDLDHFKQVNDRFGHDTGDKVLTSFATLLRTSVRAHDTVIRWGGEEFLVILPGCDQLGAAGLADRLLAACPTVCHEALPGDVSQTTSIGIAVYPGAARTPEALIGAADDALYRAKREGRNQHRTAAG
ncbi:MAG: sensor-containing diguanylate cyclase [Ilumatobacteraceae bacterium]|nr:sensor-containing diguanylate cyclase [Ilumatobacteraceae bacterium]